MTTLLIVGWAIIAAFALLGSLYLRRERARAAAKRRHPSAQFRRNREDSSGIDWTRR